jgi:hypothetical protein
VAYHRLHRSFRFRVERVIGQVIGVEMGYDGLEIRHVSRDDFGSVSSATELKVFCDVVDVRIIGGCLPVLPGTASSFEVASVPEASVSMSAALRGAKKFRVTTSLGGRCLRRATLWSALPLSLKFQWFRRWRRFRLRTSWKPSSCVACCPVVFGRLVWSARVLALITAQNSCNVSVYVPYRALKSGFPWRPFQ